MNVQYCVKVQLVSSDSDLLDQVQHDFPSAQSPRVGAEYASTRVPAADGDAERLTVRMTFASGVQGKARAEYLYEQLIGTALTDRADSWSVQLYQTPEGGVTPQEVETWYENNPDEQPVNDDGDAVIPSTWKPENHITRADSQ